MTWRYIACHHYIHYCLYMLHIASYRSLVSLRNHWNFCHLQHLVPTHLWSPSLFSSFLVAPARFAIQFLGQPFARKSFQMRSSTRSACLNQGLFGVQAKDPVSCVCCVTNCTAAKCTWALMKANEESSNSKLGQNQVSMLGEEVWQPWARLAEQRLAPMVPCEAQLARERAINLGNSWVDESIIILHSWIN